MSLKERRLSDVRVQSLQPKIQTDIIDSYMSEEDLKKSIKRNSYFKKEYRNQLFDGALCRFETKQKLEEEERKRKLSEEKIRRAKLLENRMIYYGSANMKEEEDDEDEVPLKLEAEDFAQTLNNASHTRTSQRRVI